MTRPCAHPLQTIVVLGSLYEIRTTGTTLYTSGTGEGCILEMYDKGLSRVYVHMDVSCRFPHANMLSRNCGDYTVLYVHI
jgi:hypothetical protein